MPEPAPHTVTQLLKAMAEGHEDAAEKLLPLVYDELHAIARRHMQRQRGNHTLQTTALVNEAYLRLIGPESPEWSDRRHYLAVAARAMRCVLVDHARRKHADKRGGGQAARRLDDIALAVVEPDLDLIALDDALHAFTALYPTKGRVVELRYFGGQSVEETAQMMDTSTATVKRDWSFARAWLRRHMSEDPDDDGSP